MRFQEPQDRWVVSRLAYQIVRTATVAAQEPVMIFGKLLQDRVENECETAVHVIIRGVISLCQKRQRPNLLNGAAGRGGGYAHATRKATMPRRDAPPHP